MTMMMMMVVVMITIVYSISGLPEGLSELTASLASNAPVSYEAGNTAKKRDQTATHRTRFS